MPEETASLVLNVKSQSVTEATQTLSKFSEEAKRAENSTKPLSSTTQKASEGLDKVAGSGRKAKDSLNDVDRSSRQAGGSITSISKSSEIASRSLLSLKASILGVISASALIGATTREWIGYDKAIREVDSITSQTTAEFQVMRKEVLALSSALGTDATKSAKGLYQALSAGVPRENSIQFLAVASKAAIAGVTEVEVAVDGLTNVINAFKIPVEEAESVADKLFSTVINGKTTFAELSANLSKASVPAAALGIELDELLGSVVAITKQGTPTSEAFTQMKAAIQALNDPSQEMADFLKSIGVESGRAAIEQYGLIETLNLLEQSYRGNDAALVKALRSSEAFNGVLSITGRNLDTARQAADASANSSGLMAGAYEKNAATLENSLLSLQASAISLVENMEVSLGIISKFTEALRGASMAINDIAGGTGLAGSFSSMDIENAMSQEGIVGARLQLEEIEKLQQKIQDLKAKGANANDAKDALGIAQLFSWDAANDQSLLEANAQLEKLEQNLLKISESERSLGFLQYELAGVIEAQRKATDPKQIAEYQARIDGLREDYANLTKEVEKKAVIEREAAEEIAKANSEAEASEIRRRKEALELSLQQEAAAKEQAKLEEKIAKDAEAAIDSQIAQAEELAVSERERLELLIASLGVLREMGKISDEIYTGAKTNVEGQIKELDERAAAAEVAKAQKAARDARGYDQYGRALGGGGGSRKSEKSVDDQIDSLPDLNNPFETLNEVDQIKSQLEGIKEAYEERKEAILEITGITESEKNKLLEESDKRYSEILANADRERYSARLSMASEFFGGLANMASAFGAKGAKVAKAAAITETLINTYKSATAAYAALVGTGPWGPALGAAAAAAAIANGMANVQAIRSQPVNAGAFASGGIVGGNSFQGDKMQAQVNSGEMILNRRQQANLFDVANGNGGNAGAGTVVNVVVRPTPGQTAEVKQNPNDPQQLEIILRKVDEKLNSDLQTGSGKFVPALTKRIPELKKPL